MTGAVLDRPGTQQFKLDGGLTLEELLTATLESVRATGSAECPVCRARMTSTRAGAECGGCGSRLS
jgi:tRNA(Ile2) C34 agmatinyltransferase TiaS